MCKMEIAQMLYCYNEQIEAIVSDAAAACFSGDRTAEDTASIIQDRVQTYLDEQA